MQLVRKMMVLAPMALLASGAALAQQVPPPPPGTATATQSSVTTTTMTTHRFTKPGDAMDEEAIKAAIAKAGYKEVKGLKFDDGVWEAKARGGNDNWVEIKVAPVTGKVYSEDAPSKLNEDEIKAKLTSAGYTNIGHVKFDDGLWSANAASKGGKDYDVLVDPDDGSVIARSDD